MAEPFIAEVKMVGFDFAPRGWAFCDGQIMQINQNQSLYSILGTTYGGDGRTTFALPDLRSRTPIHQSNNHALGQMSGTENVTLTAAEIAAHSHAVKAFAGAPSQPVPTGGYLADFTDGYTAPAASTNTALRSETVLNAGGGQAHNNMQPYTTVNFCIAIRGLFPARN